MKRIGRIVVVVLFALSYLYASEEESHDFTFFPTLEDSLKKGSKNAISMDYTGYAYWKKDSKAGLYLRLGFNAPYSTVAELINLNGPIKKIGLDASGEDILEDGESPLSISNLNTDSAPNPDSAFSRWLYKDYEAALTIGPAFRVFIDSSLSWYIGLGLSFEIANNSSLSANKIFMRNIFELSGGYDLDTGFMLRFFGGTSLRVGLNVKGLIIAFESVTNSRSVNEKTTVIERVSLGSGEYSTEKTINGIAYISLVTPIETKEKDPIYYRYSNKTSTLGSGERDIETREIFV